MSDGAFTGAEEFSRESASLRFIRIPGGTENVGIVGLDLRRRADGSERYEVMAQVRNFGVKPARAPLTLALGQTVLAREDMTIEPGGRRVLVHPYDGDPAGTLTAQLAIEDDFPTDNRAALTVSAAAPLRLLYVGPGNPALEQPAARLPPRGAHGRDELGARRSARGGLRRDHFRPRGGARADRRQRDPHQHGAAEPAARSSRAKCERRASARRSRSTRLPRA